MPADEEGCGETDDLIGALNWLTVQDEVNAKHLGTVGYSFGLGSVGEQPPTTSGGAPTLPSRCPPAPLSSST